MPYALFLIFLYFLPKTRDQHIHDVLNIFMLSGFTRDEGKYFVKPSPAKKGNNITISHFLFTKKYFSIYYLFAKTISNTTIF